MSQPHEKPRKFPFSTSIAEDVHAALTKHCRETGEKVTDLLDRSLRFSLKMKQPKQTGGK